MAPYISLDGILQYQPSTEPSSKPQWLPPISAGLCQPKTTQLTYPLPSRPPLPPSIGMQSHTLVNPHPASDFALKCLKPATPMHPNAFDEELAELDRVEIVDLTADGADSDVSEQRGSGYMADIEREAPEAIWQGKFISPIIIIIMLGRSVRKRALTLVIWR
jgi:hypothetical protein